MVHVDDEATIAYHCMSYALGDPSDSCFQQKCQHTHGDHCFQCEELGTFLDEIQVAVEEASFHTKNDHDEATYLVKHSRDIIHPWKAHQLRTVRQDQSRLKILRELDSGSVFITQDWAMKFLPRKYRESQSDWFGKRSISWSICIVVRRQADQFESQGFVHIIQNCTQGSSAVVSIMAHILRTSKSEHPEINQAFFRQDNAGCYHSTYTILSVPTIE